MKKTSVVTVCNRKGGVGKTTLSTNVAAVLASLGKRVLVIDLDEQCNATIGLGVDGRQGIDDKKIGRAFREDLTIQAVRVPTAVPGVDMIPGDPNLSEDREHWSNHAKRFRLISVLLNGPELHDYDTVIIDCSAHNDCYLQSALSASQYYIIPLFPENFAFRGLSKFLARVEEIRKYENPTLHFLGAVITKFDSESSSHKSLVQKLIEVSQEAKFRVFTTKIPSSTAVAAAEARNVPLFIYKPSLPSSIAYSALTGELLPLLKGPRHNRPHGAVSIPPRVLEEDFSESVDVEM